MSRPCRFPTDRHLRALPAAALLLLFLGAAAAGAQTIETVAGTGQPGNNGDNGPATRINVDQPFGVEIGPDGALYVTEVGQHRVRRVDLKTGEITTVAGTGQKGYSGDGGPATRAELNEPYEVRFDAEGNMFFVEMRNHVIRRVDRRTGVITTVAGTGQAGYGGDGGPAVKAMFSQPHSIAFDGNGLLYVCDIANHRIRRIDLSSGTVETIAGTGEKKMPPDGAVARGSPIFGPRAMHIVGRTMWLALREGNSVWTLDLDSGRLRHIAGSGKKGLSGDGGPGTLAAMNGPKGIVVAPSGKVYVVDTESHVIRQIDPTSGTITTVAGSGQRGDGGDGQEPTAARMDRPHGIGVAPDGTLFIGDTNNHRVRAFRP